MDLKASQITKMGHVLFSKAWFVCACLYFFSAYMAKAQACFTTTDTLGCVPYRVVMNACVIDDRIRYNYNYGNGGVFEDNSFHIYEKPGIYCIKQRTTFSGDTKDAEKDVSYPQKEYRDKYVVVIDGKAPEFKMLLCEDRKVLLDLTDSQFQVYAIDYGDGSPIVETGPNSKNFHTYADTSPKEVKVTGRFLSGGCPTLATKLVTPVNSLVFERFFKVVNTQEKPNSFFFSFRTNPNLSYELSNGTGEVIKSFQYSDALQTFVLEGAQGNCYQFTAKTVCDEPVFISSKLCLEDLDYELSDTSVALSWLPNDLAQVSHYEVLRDGVVLYRFDAAMPPEYDDATVKCGKSYCYEVVTKFKDSTSYSVQRCMKAISNRIPDRPYDVVSTFSADNELIVRWSIPANSSFKAAQLKSELSNKILLDARDTVYRSKVYEKSCYVLGYQDSCDKVSEVVSQICPIVIEVQPEGQGIYAVDWNRYGPVLGDVSYELYEDAKLIYSGSANSFKTLEKDTIHQVKIFHVIGVTPEGLQVRSNTIKLEQEMQVHFPTAFSPNEDGLNDVFAPKTRFVKSFKMAIYNIWGELVFTTLDVAAAWKAESYSNGTYQYIAVAEDFLGNSKELRGQVTIVR